MDSSLLLKAISGLVFGIVSLWGAYVALQKAKDSAVQKERDRADSLMKEQRERYDTELRTERSRCREEKELLIQHYERTIRTIKRLAGLPDNGPFDQRVKEETDRTKKLDRKEMDQIKKELEAQRELDFPEDNKNIQ